MARSRAADDFETIRLRMEELRRERQRQQAVGSEVLPPGHRGPCACGMSLFADECDGSCKAL